MDFGRVDTSLLETIHFSLPPDHAQTTSILSQYTKKSIPEIQVGCAKWGRADWVGKIYPKGTKAANFLDEYAKQFNCIEFNAMYYGLPSSEQIKSWKSKVGKNFKFCPKFTDVITHEKKLQNIETDLNAFIETIKEFGSNLGSVFFMPYPQMSPKEMPLILSFLESLPQDLDVFVEFRHKGWFEKNNADIVFPALEQLNKGMVITDTAGRRDCLHMRLTSPEVFIRFVGNSLHQSDYTRIDEWVERLKHWFDKGLQKCYFFVHQHEELYSPELCKYLIEQLNEKCATSIKVPRFYNEESLF